ncbi:MAG: M4 family metallopeptidase [Pyrinomonadaceae bacterium]
MRRLISYLLCVSLVVPLLNLFTPFSPQVQARGGEIDYKQAVETGIQRLKGDTNGAALVTTSRATGAARFVRLASGSGASLINAAGTAKDKSAAFFRAYGSAFGVADASAELKMESEASDATGGRHLTYRQVYNGVPVFAGVLRTHFDASGALRSVNGNFIPGISLNAAPSRKADEAAAVAVEHVRATPGDGESGAKSNAPLSAGSRTLYVFRAGLAQGIPGQNHLVWEVLVSNGADTRAHVYVDAHTGKVVDMINGNHEALNRRAYDGANLPNVPPSYPDAPVWVEGDPFPTGTPEADNMIISSKEVYDFFNNAFGRDSIDGAGHVMDAIFNRGYGCPNASWNGTFISFCPGFTTDDVTAHEWGHAYTQYTHGLIYQWQPGGLNESYSDIWGETIDRINGRDAIGNSGTDPARTNGNCSSFSPPVAQYIANSPASIAGTYPAQAAQFGPPLTGTGVTADVVLAVDDNTDPIGGTDVNDGCGAITNGAALTGKIALIRRGTCNFSAKVYNVQQAGAIAAIIFNNAATGLPGMGAGVNAGLVTIPSVGVSQAEGNNLIANIAAPPNATIKSSVGTLDNSTRWLMGEDVDPGGALRDMYNPACYSNPGKVLDTAYYVCSTADNGGVHTNSGVPNHEYALLVDGGTYNGQTINSIGLTKAAHIFFRAMNLYQHPATDFADHADAIEQSANDLIGVNLAKLTDGTPSGEIISAADVAEVQKAALAVQLRTPPTFCGFQKLLAQSPPPDSCGTGTSKAVIFHDDFEGDNSDWEIDHVAAGAGYDEPDWVVSSSLPDGVTGKAFFAEDPNIGGCNATDDESGVRSLTSPTISIPSTVTAPTLRFKHWVATETGFDGGQLLVSVDGGAYSLVPQAAFIYNAHNLVLTSAGGGNTNPRAGQRAWSGTDGGAVDGSWGESVVDLSLAGVTGGHTVKLRYDMGTDGCGGTTFGWYVDDIEVAACLADNDLSVTNTASSNRVLIGDEVTYTITVTNNGPSAANLVKLTDDFDGGQFVSAMVSQGSVSQSGGVVSADFGSLSDPSPVVGGGGTSATLTVVVKAVHAGKLSNTASVSAFEPDSAAAANNSDTEITRVVTAKRLDFVLGKVTGGCGTSTGTFKLTEVAPAGGVVIDLTSSNPAVIVPAQVTVPAGQQGVTFTATTTSVNTQRIVNITAKLHDEPTVSVVGRLTVLPTTVSNITFNPASPVHSGTPVTATVTLSCASTQNTVVKILTNKGAAKPTVSQIIIPAGQTTGQFTITTNSRGRTVSAIITAVANGGHVQRTLTVIP